MQLSKKKALAAKVLDVGKERVIFSTENLPEIKEAITRQDIRDLVSSGAISIRPIRGRKKVIRRKHRRRTGKVKQKVKKKKEDYVIMTRKLRKFAKHLLKTNQIENEKYKEVRKRIRARKFKGKRHLKESIGEL